jgi:hypothetical protein
VDQHRRNLACAAGGPDPTGFFDHVAHRSALFVLDNLDQIPGAARPTDGETLEQSSAPG